MNIWTYRQDHNGLYGVYCGGEGHAIFLHELAAREYVEFRKWRDEYEGLMREKELAMLDAGDNVIKFPKAWSDYAN